MMGEEFVVYGLYSVRFDKIYIGYTSDLLNRMKSHNHFGKNDFTEKFRPWQVIHIEFYHTKSEALKREKELKSARGRQFIRSNRV